MMPTSMSLAIRTKAYLTMAHPGGFATICTLLSYGLGWPDFVKGFSIGLMIVPLLVMLLSQFRDEYIETLWQSGTSFAFAALVLGFVGLPFLEGFYDGITGHDEEVHVITAEIAISAAFVAYYTGFHIRWLRALR